MTRFLRSRALALASAMVATVSLPTSAQRVNPRLIIDFHVNAERSNVSFGGSMIEGGRFRITTPSHNTYALSMVQIDAGRKLFVVTVFRGGGQGDTTTYRQLETVRATVDIPAPLTSLPNMTVVIEGTRRVQASATSAPVFNLVAYTRHVTKAFDDYCCIECQGYFACGCGVSTVCGYCCFSQCCKYVRPAEPASGMAVYFPDRPLQKAGRRCKEVPVNERIYPALHGGERIASR
jgi:hypothetical protein